MADKSLQDVLHDLASQSSSGDGLNLTQLKAELRQRECKIDDNYLAVLRGLLNNVNDSTLAERLNIAESTVSNIKSSKIRKDLDKLLEAKEIETPKRKQDYLYIPKLNEAGFQITVTEEKSLKDSIILVCKTAYWDICKQDLRKIPPINQEWNSGLQRTLKGQIEEVKEIPKSPEEKKESEKKTESEKKAKNTLKNFPQSSLAEKFNEVVRKSLQKSRIEEEQVKIILDRIAYRTARYLKKNIYESRNDVPQLADIYGSRLASAIESYEDIEDTYLKTIAKKPSEKVFEEKFAFKDIYVPLEVKPVKQDSNEVNHNAQAKNIEHWAKRLLLDDQRQNQVLFIQGGPGRGKSVFCRIFADWVRENLHPAWTPILIRLRDIQTFGDNLDDTLKNALNDFNFSKNPYWLNEPNTRFLFLLDGFDELLLERGVNKDLKQFLDRVSLFQKQCQKNEHRGHRVLITGRPLTLYGIERLMPPNLARVGIIPMKASIQEQWFEKWQKLAYENPELGKEKTEAFKAFLHNCPPEVQELAKEPLLLYMLAGMHRDNKNELEKLKSDMPQATKKGGAKILIYQQAIDWVLTKQRSENGQILNRYIGEIKDLRSLLAEAGLCVVQTEEEYTSLAHIENRLKEKGDERAKAIIDNERKRLDNLDCEDKDKGLKIPLAVFYIKSVPGADNSVEFVHKSFGEFFCAERMVKSFIERIKRIGTNQKITEELKKLDYEIYDLLGYGHLTPEIMEYVMALLEQAYSDKKIDLVILSEQLNDVYLRWSKGEFIEATEETLPQKKAKQLQENNISRGQRAVDIFTGLNLLIWLLELHRYGQRKENEHLKDKLTFHLCGQPETENFDETRLLRIIGYSECLAARTFNTKLGQWLSKADLSGANLSQANLSKADLSGANLSQANLSEANLSKADLGGADLSQADLSQAILSGADLSGAKLREANLSRAILREANLFGAKLREANLSLANLSGAILREANLFGAKLREANLSGANLSGADLSGANLSRAKLREANLSGANLSGANLSRADLFEANLREANLRGAILSGAILSGADLFEANLFEANLSEAIGIE